MKEQQHVTLIGGPGHGEIIPCAPGQTVVMYPENVKLEPVSGPLFALNPYGPAPKLHNYRIETLRDPHPGMWQLPTETHIAVSEDVTEPCRALVDGFHEGVVRVAVFSESLKRERAYFKAMADLVPDTNAEKQRLMMFYRSGLAAGPPPPATAPTSDATRPDSDPA